MWISWGGSGVATTTTKAGFKIWKKKEPPIVPEDSIKSIQEERDRLEAKLKNLDSAVVVLIDELDRVEDDEVRAVAQLVKAVGDIRGISYLVAYDPDRVADALGRGDGDARRASGNSYLEKIIQHPIPMRPLFTEDVDRLLQAAVDAHRVEMASANDDEGREIINLIKRELVTPREIKRLIGSFAVIEEAVRGEVNPTHVLAYCWILTKAPSLRARIAADLDKYVDDPAEEEMLRRAYREVPSRKPEDVTEEHLLGAGARPFEPLLKKLFPRFTENPDPQDGTRLSRRRNLVRVLYLGNAPGMVTRSTIEDIWGLPISHVEAALKGMRAAGMLSAFLDRLDDLLPKLPQTGDDTFWPALSRTLTRPTDWIEGPEPERNISDDAALSLFRLALRDRRNVDRVKHAVEGLIQDGDLLIAPWMLRKHMFQHGLVEDQPPRHGSTIYDEQETRELLEREVPRYREALFNGTLLRRIPDVEALFVLKNGGFWDSQLKESLTEQLSSPEAIYTLSALFTPPGHVVERKTIDELVNIEHLVAVAMNLATPTHPWLAASFRRLKLTLEGKDPTFHRDDDDND